MTQDIQPNDTLFTAPPAKISSPPIKKEKKCRDEIDWLGVPYDPVRGETALWVAVITQAMMDALSSSKSAEALYHKHEAIHWLTSNGKDFVTVCLYAGYDPDYVRGKAKRTIANPSRWRAEAGKGKRYLERKAYRKRLKMQALQPPPPPPIVAQIVPGPWAVA